MLTTVLEAILALVALTKWRSKVTLIIFVVFGIFGGFAEGAVIYASGAWTYSLPNLLNLIPLWLFITWGNATIFIFEAAKSIKRMGIKDN